jgi:serine/threonine protein kinase
MNVAPALVSCSKCGSSIPEYAPLDSCPVCLYAQALAPDDGQKLVGEMLAELGILEPFRFTGAVGKLERYSILEELGRGATGIVLKVEDVSLHRTAAIKILSPLLAQTPECRERFLREARSAAAIKHPNVVTVYDLGEWKELPYLVMEYVHGENLAATIRRDGLLPIEETVRIGREIALALAAAHEQGLIHRDIKPANILIEQASGTVKVTDFGLARAADEPGLTLSGTVIGTPDFMAPEQARGESADFRTDLYALGCVIYAMCTGRPPFRGPSAVATMYQLCNDEAVPISKIRPDIPDWLKGLVAALLKKDSNDRPASARAVVEAFEMRKSPQVLQRRRPLITAALVASVVFTIGVLTFVIETKNSNDKLDPLTIQTIPQVNVAQTVHLKTSLHNAIADKHYIGNEPTAVLTALGNSSLISKVATFRWPFRLHSAPNGTTAATAVHRKLERELKALDGLEQQPTLVVITYFKESRIGRDISSRVLQMVRELRAKLGQPSVLAHSVFVLPEADTPPGTVELWAIWPNKSP